MGYKTNYADNIFFLSQYIKNLQQGLNLELDPNYFRDKILEDILFLDSCLARLYSSLRNSNFLITRNDHLRDLQRAISLFVKFIDSILDNSCTFTELKSAKTKLTACRIEQEKNRSDISSIISGTPTEEESEDTVSQDEFRFLLEQDYDNEE